MLWEWKAKTHLHLHEHGLWPETTLESAPLPMTGIDTADAQTFAKQRIMVIYVCLLLVTVLRWHNGPLRAKWPFLTLFLGLCFPVILSSTTYLSKSLRKDIAMMIARPTRNAILTAVKKKNKTLSSKCYHKYQSCWGSYDPRSDSWSKYEQSSHSRVKCYINN